VPSRSRKATCSLSSPEQLVDVCESIPGLALVEPIDFSVSPRTRSTVLSLSDAVANSYNVVDHRVPVDQLDLDSQLPQDLPAEDEIEGAKSRYTLIVDLAHREKLTVRQLIARLGGGRGHRTFTGTPEQVANAIVDWFAYSAADGFNIMPAVLPSGLELFVDHVVPILRSRGFFRTEYTGRTLREHYGLPRPTNRHLEVSDERVAL